MPKTYPYATTTPVDVIGIQGYKPAMQFYGYKVEADVTYLTKAYAMELAQKMVDDYNLQNITGR